MMFNKATICRSFMKSFIIHTKMSSILLHISVPLVIHLKATPIFCQAAQQFCKSMTCTVHYKVYRLRK
jgi:hypothetical protein